MAKCPDCGEEFELRDWKIPTHDFPKPCRRVCHGSGKSPGLRVLVTGGRNFSDWELLCKTLNSIHQRRGIALVIEGGNRPPADYTGEIPTRPAKSADFLAWCWARERKVQVITVRANWDAHGKAAGPIRNNDMAMKPDLLISFAGGRGTADCVLKAHLARIPVLEVSDDLGDNFPIPVS